MDVSGDVGLAWLVFGLICVDCVLIACILQLILPHSTWSMWAGVLSDAEEIHVTVEAHPLRPNSTKYVYHSEWKSLYFGRYNETAKAPTYSLKLLNNSMSCISNCSRRGHFAG